jgi:hypothetical protein
VKIQEVVRRSRARIAAALAGCLLLWARPPRAEVTLAEAKGFQFFSEGRVNSFASLGFGDDFPEPSPNPDGGPPHSVLGGTALYAQGQNTDQDDARGKYFAVRGRNGFVATILALGMRKQLTESTSIKGYIALWGHAESFNRDRATASTFDVREGYMDFEGPWGSLTAGRALGLFGRISTEIDFNYGHNYGLGYPCGDSVGPTCGHIGTGVMFPGFAAGFQYSTPSLAGLKVHAGLYDPVRLLGAWNRAAIARPEGALSFEQKFAQNGLIKLQVEGVWQPVSRSVLSTTTPVTKTLITETVWGVAGGARFELGPLRLGAAVFTGKGLGQYFALVNSPVVFAQNYDLRSFTGVYAQAAVVVGAVQLAAGAGRVGVNQLAEDKIDPGVSTAKSQTGISAAVYYSLSDSLVLGLDYFRFRADWYGARRSTTDAATNMTVLLPGNLGPEQQVVSYINAGATFHW